MLHLRAGRRLTHVCRCFFVPLCPLLSARASAPPRLYFRPPLPICFAPTAILPPVVGVGQKHRPSFATERGAMSRKTPTAVGENVECTALFVAHFLPRGELFPNRRPLCSHRPKEAEKTRGLLRESSGVCRKTGGLFRQTSLRCFGWCGQHYKRQPLLVEKDEERSGKMEKRHEKRRDLNASWSSVCRAKGATRRSLRAPSPLWGQSGAKHC